MALRKYVHRPWDVGCTGACGRNLSERYQPIYYEQARDAQGKAIFRPPKEGEHYLSGAIPEVYEALGDMTTAYQLMVRVQDPPKTIEKDGFRYRLEGPTKEK